MRLSALFLAIPLVAVTHPLGPGVDVRRIAFDGQGFVWVSGEQGTFRFDGVTYLPASRLGLPVSGSNHVAVTGDGTVWAQAANTLWRLDGDRFLQASPGNVVTPIEAAGEFLYTNPGPLRVWYRQGKEWRAADGPAIATSLRLHGEPDGRVWFGGSFAQGKPSTVQWVRFRNGAFERGEETLHREMLPQREVVPAGNGTIFTAHTTGVFRFERSGGHFFFASEYTSALPVGARLLAGDSREVWYEACSMWLSSKGRSLRLPGAKEMATDLGGNVWAALGDKGLQFSGGGGTIGSYSVPTLSDRPVMAVSRNAGRLFVARQDVTAVIEGGAAFCDGSANAEATMRPWGQVGENAPFSGLAADADGSVWVAGKNQGVMHMSGDGRYIGVVPSGGTNFVANIRQIVFSVDGRLWVASKENLAEVQRQPTLRYAGVYPTVRYVSGFVRDGARLFAIADGGLPLYENGVWRETPLPPCLLSQKLRTVAFASDRERWFAYRNQRGFTKAVSDGAAWSCRHFEESNGFPGDTQFLGVDGKGRLWRGSNLGAFVRREGDRWARLVAPDGEMHQLFHNEPDGAVMIAMGDRLLRLPSRLADGDPGLPPAISYLETGDGGIELRPTALVSILGHGAVLHLSALPERELGAPNAIEYRFDAGSWSRVRDHAIPMDDAPRSARRVEFRYAGSSNAVGMPVSIGIPWWRSYWFGGSLSCLFLLPVFWLTGWLKRRRYHERKRRFMADAEPTPGRLSSVAVDGGLTIGALLKGRYRVNRLIADGGFSQVFEAMDEDTGNRVVVKRLRTSGIPVERLGRRLAQEVAAASMVNHPGIVPITDTWIDGGMVPHLVMPYVNGSTLRDRLRNGRFDRGEAMELLRRLSEVLAAAHARGVVHSDFKPENILLAREGPLIIDFGASALHLSTGLNEYSRPAGSVHYMAPEQLLGRYSKATDVYAFALVAFEMLTGRRYSDVDLPMSELWEPEFRRAAVQEFGLSAPAAGVFVEALRFDPERRAQDVGAWMRRLGEAG